MVLVAGEYGHSASDVECAFDEWKVESDGLVYRRPRSAICFVKSDFGTAVLKIPRLGGEEDRAAEYLTRWRGRGVVRPLATRGPLQLLPRLRASSTLLACGPGVGGGGDIQVLAELARQMLDSGATVEGALTSLPWGEALVARRSIKTAPVTAAARLYAELAATQGSLRLLHGDLHHENVLSDGLGRWVAIDPKGVAAEPEFELACGLRNPVGAAEVLRPDMVRRRLSILVTEFSMDRSRLVGWAWSQAVLAAEWAHADGESTAWWLAVADAYRNV